VSSDKIKPDMLHPALRNSPNSEIQFLRKFVQLVLSKSSKANFYLSDSFIQEVFMQIISKTCLIPIVDLFSNPNFLYYSVALLCNKKYEIEIDKVDKTEEIEKQNETSEFFDVLENTDQNSGILSSPESDHSSRIKSVSSYDLQSITDTKSAFSLDSSASKKSDQSSSKGNFKIHSIKISSTETNYEPNTGNPYTLYMIKVCFKLLF
jgi:hypothetical protein